MLLYKVLNRVGGDLVSPYQDYKYPIGEVLTCKDFNADKEIDCAEGFYATEIEGLIYAYRNLPDNEVWSCEVGGRSVEIDQFKRRHETIKLIEHVPNQTVKELALNEEYKVGYKLSEALFPINPFKIRPPIITKKEINLVKQWALIMDPVVTASPVELIHISFRGPVWTAIIDSIGDPAWKFIWNLVGRSFKYSVWDSVRALAIGLIADTAMAYITSLFPNIVWKCIGHEKGKNPFQPTIDLWRMGLVPSYYNEMWRLHGGKDGRILWQEGE